MSYLSTNIIEVLWEESSDDATETTYCCYSTEDATHYSLTAEQLRHERDNREGILQGLEVL